MKVWGEWVGEEEEEDTGVTEGVQESGGLEGDIKGELGT